MYERKRERKRDIDGEERKRRYWLVVNFNSDNISRIKSPEKFNLCNKSMDNLKVKQHVY